MTLGHFSKDLIRPPVSGGQSAGAVLQDWLEFLQQRCEGRSPDDGIGKKCQMYLSSSYELHHKESLIIPHRVKSCVIVLINNLSVYFVRSV